MSRPTADMGLLELSASLAAMGASVTRNTNCQYCAPRAPCPFHITFSDRQAVTNQREASL
jgi:hypothetical protein